jgi:acyl transferase domain-containing protein
MALTRSLQDRLFECGIAIRTPAYGHAIVIDLSQYTADPGNKDSKVKLLRDLFIETGIRGGIHQVGKQRQSLLNRCIRLAFPLGLLRESEEVIFDKLKGFFTQRILKSEKLSEDLPIINDLAPYLSEADRESIDAEPSRKKICEIAIIGLGGKFPRCNNHYEFWEKITLGYNFVSEVPSERWNHLDHYDPAIGKTFVPHKTRCQFGAFLNSHDCFDAAFFRLAPEEVVMMDPQERLAMESVWACIEDAGYVPEQLGSDVGLFAGMTYNEYQKVVPRTTHSCFITSRLAYFFNFHGPAMAVDTGCASSMTAIDTACSNLADGRCQTAVVTGSSVILHPDHYASLSPELSTTGIPESKPFGNADGWIPAEGVVAILLKRVDVAVRDGDHIYGVIKSSLTGHEGKTSWFSAFNPKRQAGLIDANFERAGVDPTTISYVEAAANGSPLGDAIELEGLTTAFGKWTQKKEFCPIGSVKSYVGHGEGVSTMLQLAKVLLQFKAKRIYPLLHRDPLNPNIRIEESSFRFPVSIEKWQQPSFVLHEKRFSVPRRATISSFGGGGNMGHLILEEAPPVSIGSNSWDAYFIPISSGSAAQLLETVADYLSFFRRIERVDSNWRETYQMLNVMRTLCQGRVMFSHRVVFIAPDLETLKRLFGCFLKSEPDGNIITKKEGVNPRQIPLLIQRKAWHDIGQQWANGTEINWREFFQSAGGKRVPLPAYCFEKRRFEISKEAFLAACRFPREKPHVQAPVSNPSGKSPNIELSHIVEEAFAKVLSITSSTIDLQAPLDQYGFDSVMVISVAAELERHFVRVPHTLFFECSTIQEVIDYLRNLYPGKDAADVKRDEISKTITDELPDLNPDLDQMTEAIMSDLVTVDEVLAQL